MEARQVIAPNWRHKQEGNSLELVNNDPYIEIYINEEKANNWHISFRTKSSELYISISARLSLAQIPNLLFNNYYGYNCFSTRTSNATNIWLIVKAIAEEAPLADKMREISELLRLKNPRPIENKPHTNEAQPEVPNLQQQNADLLRLNEELRRENEALKGEIDTLKAYYNPPQPSAPPRFFK
jgi:hypothetical protein